MFPQMGFDIFIIIGTYIEGTPFLFPDQLSVNNNNTVNGRTPLLEDLVLDQTEFNGAWVRFSAARFFSGGNFILSSGTVIFDVPVESVLFP
jgi:hypothetical protein